MKRNLKGIPYRKTETCLGHDLEKKVICPRFNEASGLALKFIHPLLDIADFSEQVSAKCCITPSGSTFLFPRVGRGTTSLNLLYAYPYNKLLSCSLENKETMNLQTTSTNIPKVELRKTRLWKTLYKVGEILLMVLVTLALLAFLFSYLALSFISPAG